MLIRQTMGGKLTNFDIHMIASYVGGGFVMSISAVFPKVSDRPARALNLNSSVLLGPELNPNSGHQELWIRDHDGYVVVIATHD
jgi:hypothetical protein